LLVLLPSPVLLGSERVLHSLFDGAAAAVDVVIAVVLARRPVVVWHAGASVLPVLEPQPGPEQAEHGRQTGKTASRQESPPPRRTHRQPSFAEHPRFGPDR